MSNTLENCNGQSNVVKYIWTINNFSKLKNKTGQPLNSPIFPIEPKTEPDLKWSLKLFPKGITDDSKDYLSIFLCLESYTQNEIEINFMVTVLNANRKTCFENNSKPHDRVILKYGIPYGWVKFIAHEYLENTSTSILPNDNLTVICKITILKYGRNCDNVASTCSLSRDFGRLFENQELSDITLYAGGKTFKAHKVILAARSSVFKAMLENKKRKKQKCIEIMEISSEVLEEMLCYIYTGKVSNLKENAHELFLAADRYKLNNLKVLCKQQLHNNFDTL